MPAKKFLTWWLVRLVNAKNSPNLIPMGGNDEKMRARNYFSLTFAGNDGTEYLFKKLRRDIICSRGWVASRRRFTKPMAFTISKASKMDFECRFYYGYMEFKFSNRLTMFLSLNTGWWKIQVAIATLSRFLFNKRSFAAIQRADLMSYIAERTLADKKFAPSPYGRLEDKYGERVWRHPDLENLLRRETMLLDSLLVTEDLIKGPDGIGYRMAPKLLVTLEKLATDERRYRASNRIQGFLILVAVLSAIAAGVQAWVAYSSTKAHHAESLNSPLVNHSVGQAEINAVKPNNEKIVRNN